jgi:glycyl-tRNA synthetase beta chain
MARAALGRFDDAFLEVPREVIQLTMRTNQKYFACPARRGGARGEAEAASRLRRSTGATRPRLHLRRQHRRHRRRRPASSPATRKSSPPASATPASSGKQDLKIPLEQQAAKLGQIVFHEKLGTVADKVDRVAKLARWLVEEGIVKGRRPDLAERAARLCKADLVTQMVGEFPELQGLIGGYLAAAQGEDSRSRRRHSRPLQAGRAGG